MRLHRLEREQRVGRPPAETFELFADAHKLEQLTPSWLRFRVLTPRPIELRAGALIDYRLCLHGLPVRWRTRIAEWVPERCFVDVQVAGPYRVWHHTHEFRPDGEGGTAIRDLVRYALPLGPLGALAHPLLVRRDLERIFDYRHAAVERLLGGRTS